LPCVNSDPSGWKSTLSTPCASCAAVCHTGRRSRRPHTVTRPVVSPGISNDKFSHLSLLQNHVHQTLSSALFI
jgi:hypothetical protein